MMQRFGGAEGRVGSVSFARTSRDADDEDTTGRTLSPFESDSVLAVSHTY